jgi:hypothetical protein
MLFSDGLLPSLPSNCFLAIHKFDRANSVMTCAVFFASPRNLTFDEQKNLGLMRPRWFLLGAASGTPVHHHRPPGNKARCRHAMSLRPIAPAELLEKALTSGCHRLARLWRRGHTELTVHHSLVVVTLEDYRPIASVAPPRRTNPPALAGRLGEHTLRLPRARRVRG